MESHRMKSPSEPTVHGRQKKSFSGKQWTSLSSRTAWNLGTKQQGQGQGWARKYVRSHQTQAPLWGKNPNELAKTLCFAFRRTRFKSAWPWVPSCALLTLHLTVPICKSRMTEPTLLSWCAESLTNLYHARHCSGYGGYSSDHNRQAPCLHGPYILVEGRGN